MNRFTNLMISVCLITGILLTAGCKKDPSLAILTTTAVTEVTISSITTGGEISSSGGANIIVRGVCWGTSQKPVATAAHTVDGKGSGSFSSTITGLDPNTKYYIRAYATNSAGTAYGDEVSTTTTALTVPTVTTSSISQFTFTSATAGGTITSDGHATVTEKGVCWSESANPSIDGNHLAITSGTTSFSAEITNLTPGTTYHVRTYATNSVGTGYGSDITFTTTALNVPTLSTSAIVQGSIGYNSATSGGTISNNGGSDIQAMGVCWSLSQNPTILGDHSSDTPVGNTFVSQVERLQPGVTYYVRAYATNQTGTGYGNEISFTTNAVVLATVTTRAITQISFFSAASGGDITDAGGGSISKKGVCWSAFGVPTADSSHTDNGSGTENFASVLNSLTQGTHYNVRAYATNSKGTAYGSTVDFSTLTLDLPVLTTTEATLITANSARSGGNISSAGGGSIIARGVCWSTSANPTINNSKSTSGTGTGTFSTDLTGLQSSTVYYYRAYATNERGTAYGPEYSLTTLTITLPVVSTSAVSSLTSSSASSGGNVTDAGNAAILARGVCWSTSPTPTTTNNHTSDGTTTGSFTSALGSLSGNTTYYVRAYATNSLGTGYGSELTFKTYAATDVDGNNYTAAIIGTQTWLVENLKSTRYNNGDVIGTTTPMTLDITTAVTPKYQWPTGGNESYVADYGRYYTYWVITDARGICPTGWHVPTDTEWESMKTFLGGQDPAGGKLKEAGTAHWQTPNTGATNETGFTALPGGYRSIAGAFVSLTVTGYFWSTTLNPFNVDWAWGQGLHYNDAVLLRGGYFQNDGANVRCLKN
jgi:uncharacterized protein (TIGR02145 family)